MKVIDEIIDDLSLIPVGRECKGKPDTGFPIARRRYHTVLSLFTGRIDVCAICRGDPPIRVSTRGRSIPGEEEPPAGPFPAALGTALPRRVIL